MLHLYFDSLKHLVDREDFIRYPSFYFDEMFTSSWLNDDFAKRVIEEIDGIKVSDFTSTEEALIRTGISAEKLCTGTKNLIICKFENMLNRITMMGENCYPFLMELAEAKEVYMGCSNFVYFDDNVLQGRTIHMVNNDAYVSTYNDYERALYDIVGSGEIFEW